MRTLIQITWIPVLIVVLFVVHTLLTKSTGAPRNSASAPRWARSSVTSFLDSSSSFHPPIEKVSHMGALIRLN
jgi:hypothetical protein